MNLPARPVLLVTALVLGCAHGGGKGLIEPDTIQAGQPGGTLTVRVSGVDPRSGTVRVGLFDKEDGFPTEEGLLVGRRVPASQAVEDVVEVAFPATPQGRYALSVYLDMNDNEQLDEGSFGIPTEPYGFSRGAMGHFGPPEFEDAAFNHGFEEQLVPLHLGGIRLTPR
ncbi:MAG: DUF2141 domain-containing protein [Deltaproteobacteria bacterium]|nr:DUF2141 domain-containing protein [Deltaproteobacteria bacterium]